MRRASRIRSIEGLRAVAALAVLVTHLTQASGYTSAHEVTGALTARLNLGVALFFVLSAYLLYTPWVDARLNGAATPRVRRYAARRALRILPAYWVALLALAVLLPDQVPGALGEDWWIYFGLLQVYSPDTILGGIPVAWSLSTEVAFYAALPVVASVTGRLLAGRERRVQVRAELLGLAATVVVAFVLREVAVAQGWVATYSNTLPGRWPWFAVGLGLAVARAAWAGRPLADRPVVVRSAAQHPWAWWTAAAAAVLVAAYGVLPREVFLMTPWETHVETALFAVVGLGLLGPVVLGSEARGPSRVLAAPVAVWLGTVSYGIFLWHLPVQRWVILHVGGVAYALVSTLLAITCAAVSWYLIERPALRERTVRRAPAAPAVEPAP